MNVWQIAMTGVGAYSAAIIGACLWLKWRDRRKLLPRRVPVGDYVPDEWVAEYREQSGDR